MSKEDYSPTQSTYPDNVHDKLNNLIDHLQMVVSIGASSDEEEVSCSRDATVGSVETTACDCRDEVHDISCSFDKRDTDLRDDVIQKIVVTIGELDDSRCSTPDNTSPLKFGKHRIRDSIYIGLDGPIETIIQDCDDNGEEETEEEDSSALGVINWNGRQAPMESIEIECNKCGKDDDSVEKSHDDATTILQLQQQLTSKLKSPVLCSRRLMSLHDDVESSSPKAKASLSFSTITVRSYPMIVGNHPNTKYGPPISIGWEYHEYDSLSLNEYEAYRGEKGRKLKDLYLNSGRRRRILQRAGFSLAEMSVAINTAQIDQLLRTESKNDTVENITSYFDDEINAMTKKNLKSNVNCGWKKTVIATRCLGKAASQRYKQITMKKKGHC